MLRNPLFSKVLMIALLALFLLLPLGMIQSKIGERQSLQESVKHDIERTTSGQQTIAGPFLVVQYKLREHSSNELKPTTESEVHEKVISPHSLKIVGDADVEVRSRGIYKAQLFNLHSVLTGDFVVPKGYGINRPLDDIIPVAAYFVMGVSDARGIRNAPTLTLNGNPFEFLSGSIGPIASNGIHVPLKMMGSNELQNFNFSFPLELQGMSTLAVAPSGNNTEMELKSSWPHPSFGGDYRPNVRSVDEKGFSAKWQVTNLARNTLAVVQNEAKPGAEIFSVDFINPIDVYQLSDRAVKYGVLFVILVFTAFFMFEILRKLRIHPMQYFLVGLALAMFFLLLISLSEHISFLSSYVISGGACSALIGIYLVGVTKNIKPALAFSGGIGMLYAVLYGVLQSESNALLMGTLILFIALTALMVLTRHTNWYELGEVTDDNKI